MNINAFDFAVLGLAAWRLASLITLENGPANVLQRIRQLFGVRMDSANPRSYAPSKPGTLAELFTCVWCMSLWVSLLVLLYPRYPAQLMLCAMPLAISGFAVLVQSVVARNGRH